MADRRGPVSCSVPRKSPATWWKGSVFERPSDVRVDDHTPLGFFIVSKGLPIIVLVGLHVSAVLFYALVKKDNLVRPMITGMKEVDEADAQPAQGGGAVAFIVALTITAAVLYVVTGSFIEPPPPPPPAAW